MATAEAASAGCHGGEAGDVSPSAEAGDANDAGSGEGRRAVKLLVGRRAVTSKQVVDAGARQQER